MYSANVYFDYPLSGSNYISGSPGYAEVEYRILRPSQWFWSLGNYETRLRYPDGHQADWENTGKSGEFYLVEAGSYTIQARVRVNWDGNYQQDYWIYSYEIPFTVTDNNAPAIPQNFSASFTGQHPILTWSSNTETDLASYIIAKMIVEETGWANVDTVSSSTTQWTDNTVEQPGKFDPVYTINYKIRSNDINNNSSSFSNEQSVTGYTNYLWKSSNTAEDESILDYKLYANYPNPFNPTTRIDFQIPQNDFVNLSVFNSIGQKVAVLINNILSKGKYSVEFDASNLPSGIYIYKIQSNYYNVVKKMILTK